MTTADVLREARALYAAAPSHAVPGQSPKHDTECVMTAICAVTTAEGAYWDAVEALRRAVGDVDSLVAWNAEHSTAEVLAAFDRAIEACAVPA